MTKQERRVYNRVDVLRTERGLSRKQIAHQLDINHQTVGYIERGDYNPSLELALRLADLFQLPIEAIFSLKPLTPLSDELYREPRTRTDSNTLGEGPTHDMPVP
jgi:putative transcriptional regulator